MGATTSSRSSSTWPTRPPHWPLHALPEDVAKYEGAYDAGWEVVRQQRYERLIASGIIDSAWALPPLDVHAPDMVIPPWDTLSPEMQEKWALRMEVYAAMVDRLDQNIGRIMDRLEARGEADNTLVLFLSDNGATDEEIGSRSPVPPGGRTSYMGQGGPWAQVSNAPFRLFKHWVHEGGIATPLIARWPDGIESPDRLYRHPAHVIDVMATAVEVAGARYPEVYDGRLIQPLEGRSLVPVLKGDTAAVHQALFWEHQGNRAVRHGKWKLVELLPARVAALRHGGRPHRAARPQPRAPGDGRPARPTLRDVGQAGERAAVAVRPLPA